MGVWDRLLPGSATRRGAEALELERCSARGHGMARQGREETSRKVRQSRKRGRGPGGVRASDVVHGTRRRGHHVGGTARRMLARRAGYARGHAHVQELQKLVTMATKHGQTWGCGARQSGGAGVQHGRGTPAAHVVVVWACTGKGCASAASGWEQGRRPRDQSTCSHHG